MITTHSSARRPPVASSSLVPRTPATRRSPSRLSATRPSPGALALAPAGTRKSLVVTATRPSPSHFTCPSVGHLPVTSSLHPSVTSSVTCRPIRYSSVSLPSPARHPSPSPLASLVAGERLHLHQSPIDSDATGAANAQTSCRTPMSTTDGLLLRQ